MYRTLIFGMATALMLAGKASAQSTFFAAGYAPTGAGTTNTGVYDRLSPGNQKIAAALFDAQQVGDGSAAWSIDDIALAKRKGTGWVNVFKRMKADGLVKEMNLGQIISGRGNAGPGNGLQTGSEQRAGIRNVRPVRANVIVTTADGKRVIYGLSKPRQRAIISAKARARRTAERAGKTAAWVGGKAVKSHGVRTMGKTSQPTVSLTARRAVVATRQSARLGHIARGAGQKIRKAK